MKIEKLNLRDTHTFSDFFLDYLDDKDVLRSFYGLRPDVSGFAEQMRRKEYSASHRSLLCRTLHRQYEKVKKPPALQTHLAQLSEPNTYTVTTGHQLSLLTGPLYFMYKIMTVVNACRALTKEYPHQNFVPVYWMASEDHDFDEVSSFHLFGKKYVWESREQGAVGRFSTEGIVRLLDDLPERVDTFEKAYGEAACLSDAVRYYVNEYFAEAGVVVLDADDAALKSSFADMIHDDLTHHSAHRLIAQTNEQIISSGYKPQLAAHPINFFYLQTQSRERILKVDDHYRVHRTALTFSAEEVRREIRQHPERFSPNVAMRPLYQETLLPNLAYVGGPAEVAYWMQLKKVFEHYGVAFPMLMPRNFALYVDAATTRRMQKLQWSATDLFKPEPTLKAQYLAQNAEPTIALDAEVAQLHEVYETLTRQAQNIDASLGGAVAAEWTKASKGLKGIEKRLNKALEQKHEVALHQIRAVKEKLFPRADLQERQDNFLQYHINRPDFLKDMMAGLDPFDYRMHVFLSA